MQAQLQKALKYAQTIEMMYLAKDGSITKRKVKPLKMYGNKIQAYCFVRQEKRLFLIDHILACTPILSSTKKAI
jgi:predicted DNA-binding transcriptional regulator YafY